MFTGIISDTGKVLGISDSRFVFESKFGLDLEIGESIALNGMCGTVIEFDENIFVIEIMEESRDKTTFGVISVGDMVNYERSALVGTRNSGHQVSGHVDARAEVLGFDQKSDFWELRISLDSEFRKWLIHKGSVAIEGISLTVMEIGDGWFSIGILDYTRLHTNLCKKQAGHFVNLEFDIFGKYIATQFDLYRANI